jgi:hypothetical protein
MGSSMQVGSLPASVRLSPVPSHRAQEAESEVSAGEDNGPERYTSGRQFREGDHHVLRDWSTDG